MKIAIFDYFVTATNPTGSCHLKMLGGLCEQHEFTVFAARFENPCPERIEWVRVRLPQRPLALTYVLYHLLAPFVYAIRHLRRPRAAGFDIIQIQGTNLAFGDVSYAHFCNRAYLRNGWPHSKPRGLRRVLRWVDHQLPAQLEPWTFRRARCVVVPSQGLARELLREYPCVQGKLHVLPNPVDLERMLPPAEFPREAFRGELGIRPEEVCLAFVALGHFERKGLPLVLEAMRTLSATRLRLLVVGGPPDLVSQYRRRVASLGLECAAIFVGNQTDVRPFLWASDGFIFPSLYEAFPLVSLEAAAAGLPLLAAKMNGIEEFLCDGKNGLVVERSPEGVADALRRFLDLRPEVRRAMGAHAQLSVRRYSVENFVQAWRALYAELAADVA